MVTTNEANLRNYPLATKFATDALMRTGNLNSKLEIADTLACAHMAQGHREEAMRIVSEYSLSDRSQDFLKNTLCKDVN